jgi:hypothetical protein
MNLTKRHGIDIKLSKKFNMNSLREVICDDEINSDIIIPQNNRILLFEDIDAMGDVVKDRDLPKEQQDVDIEAKIKEALFKKSKRGSRKSMDENDSIFQEASNDNNNLSYFLNILDGLHECPGRIIIMTTNKPEYLDKALIRPGRIDFKLNMTKASIDDIKDILNFYWKTNLSLTIDVEFDKKLSHADVISCCRMSSNIEESIVKIGRKSIDIDSNVTLTEESNEELIDSFEDKFVIYKTINNGYHILYRCSKIEGNKKIAKLKGQTEAIIETRGIGGYVFVYENQISEKSYTEIQEISELDREVLFEISKTYNYS